MGKSQVHRMLRPGCHCELCESRRADWDRARERMISERRTPVAVPRVQQQPRVYAKLPCSGKCGTEMYVRADIGRSPMCQPCRKVRQQASRKRCSRDDCDRVSGSLEGLCGFHLNRLRTGIPLDAPLGRRSSSKAFAALMKPCTYQAAHKRCRKIWGKASEHDCAGGCGLSAREWAYDGKDPTELCGEDEYGPGRVYSRFPEFYMPMCRSCHTERDKVWRRQLQSDFEAFLKWRQSKG